MTRRQQFVRPRHGTITRQSDGAVQDLKFEPHPDNPHDFRAIDATTGLHITFHPGDVVTVDQKQAHQSILIADRVTHRSTP